MIRLRHRWALWLGAPLMAWSLRRRGVPAEQIVKVTDAITALRKTAGG